MSTESGWMDFFDGHAPEYEQNCFTKNTLAEVDFLEKELDLPAGAAILDVGCGTGRHAIELARRGYEVTGLDASTGMLEEARKRAASAGVEVEWLYLDATRFSFPARFDAVICLCEGAFGLLGSRDDPVAQPLSILENVGGAMKAGAMCLFTVLNGYALARRHGQAAVDAGEFDPLGLAERSECKSEGAGEAAVLWERGFVPTEFMVLFALAGLDVTNIWGGTAGNWGKRPIDLDEIEIMVMARRREER